jgi:hypothetical protein
MQEYKELGGMDTIKRRMPQICGHMRKEEECIEKG